jgi:sulfocyanin
VAGLTSANNAWNFNGYANGELTIIVPVGSRVVIPFSNLDGNVPHSFGIIAGGASNLVTAPDRPLVFGAATRRYETGIRSVERDVVRFTASEAGEYLFACGVPGHAAGGMWIRFHVSSSAMRPEIRTRS